MSLNDEIGNFSKRRDVKKLPKEHENHDEESYEKWEEEDAKIDNFSSLNFKWYDLSELDKLNQEVKELDLLISPWWKNLKTIFTKTTFSKIGLIEYKKKHLFRDDSFEGIEIVEVDKSLDALKVFRKSVKRSYVRRLKFSLFGVLSYLLLAFLTAWNMIWYFLVGWSLFNMIIAYLKHQKEKEWLEKAKNFLNAEDRTAVSSQNIEMRDTRLEDVMAFNEFVSKEEKEHWSIKIYDAIENLFRRKK